MSFNNVLIPLFLLSTTYAEVQAILPWDQWTWSAPQEPIEYFFRRRDNNIINKNQDIECECPPYKECSMDFKFNEDMLHFLQIKGLIGSEELKQLQKDFLNNLKNENWTKKTLTRKRRNGNIILPTKEIKKDCCCPPRTLKLPTFITNEMFDDVIERVNKIKNDTI